ncbi:MAG: sulfotransferase family protein [bacterium]
MARFDFDMLSPYANGMAKNWNGEEFPLAHEPAREEAEKIEVIYLLGCGRSGSTLLDLVLGSHHRVASVGEIWYHHRWLENNFECTCGAPFESCDFWQAVTEKLRGSHNQAGVTPVQSRRGKVRALLQLLAGGKLPARAQTRGYALATYRLFKAVQEVSQKPVILDSSKNPMRLLYLGASGLFKIKIIHLIRDGRAYVNSTRWPVKMPAQGGQTAPAQSVWRATWRWLLTNSLSSLICSRLPKASWCAIKYEDFASAPVVVMQRLCEFLDIQYSPDLLAGDKPVTHNISGSRWRYQAGRTIRLDEKWRAELPARRRLAFTLLAGWLNRKYGYK